MKTHSHIFRSKEWQLRTHETFEKRSTLISKSSQLQQHSKRLLSRKQFFLLSVNFATSKLIIDVEIKTQTKEQRRRLETVSGKQLTSVNPYLDSLKKFKSAIN